jgi:HdeA/HdeB family
MKSGLIFLAFVAFMVPGIARAQLTVDMAGISCGQYLAMPASQSDKFSAWMSGWFSYKNDRPFVDLVAHQKNIASVKEWCKFHPSEKVMTGLKNAIVVD